MAPTTWLFLSAVASTAGVVLACNGGVDSHSTFGDETAPPSAVGSDPAPGCDPLEPGNVVDIDAMTPDGHHIVVIAPEHITSDDQYRVFYGTADAMAEQHAQTSVNAEWFVDFTLGGVEYSTYPDGGPEPFITYRNDGGTTDSFGYHLTFTSCL